MIVYLDFETYYDPQAGYSLSKQATQAYLRDPRFRCLGCAIAVDDGPALYVQPERLADVFAAIPWQTVTAVAHNAGFDLALLADRYGYRPATAHCTQALARLAVASGWVHHTQRSSVQALAPLVGLVKGDTAHALAAGGQVLADYALTDVAVCRRLYQLWAPRASAFELDIINLHLQISIGRPLSLDTALLNALKETQPHPAAAALRSANTFAACLRQLGIEPGTKTSARTGKTAYAFARTDNFMQGLSEHPDPRVLALHNIRLTGTSNIVKSRAERLLSCVPTDDKSFGAPLLYYGCFSGRSSAA